MAITQRGTATTVRDGTAATAIAVPLPAGVVAGDVLIVHFSVSAAATITPPSGWVLAHTIPNAGYWATSHLFTRVADGTEGAAPTFTSSASAATKTASCAAFSGVNTGSIWDSTPQSSAYTSGVASFSVPAITAGSAGRMLVGGALAGSTATWSPPSGWTEAVDANNVTVATRQLDGASGTVSFTPSVSTTGNAWSGALRMAAPPPQGAAAGGYNYTGSASGAFPTSGNAAGGYNYEGMATGAQPYTGPAGNAAGSLNYTGAATGDRPVIWRQFTPPIRYERIPTDQKPFKFYQQQVAMSVVLRNGHFQEVRFPAQEETDQLMEGVSWFAGGRPYLVDDETATLLAGDGFTIT